MFLDKQDMYDMLFSSFPDVLNVKQISELFGISTKTVYKLIKSGELDCVKIGREFRIPKVTILKKMNIIQNSPTK